MSTVVDTLRDQIIASLEENKEKYIEISHAIHDRPEIGNEEFYASKTHAELLESEGFTVERGVAGHETALLARHKSDKPGPAIAFLA